MQIKRLEGANIPTSTLNLLNIKYQSGLYEALYNAIEARKKKKKKQG